MSNLAAGVAARAAFYLVLIGSVTAATPPAHAQKNVTVEVAPVPAPILSAKTVFIANAADDSTPSVVKFTGSPDVVYDEFYAAVKASGRYQIVDTPADADMIFEINYKGNPAIPAELDLHILDVKTHTLLWTIREQVPGVFLTKNVGKKIKQTIDRIVADVLALYGAPA
jgi:hypothetical protein